MIGLTKQQIPEDVSIVLCGEAGQGIQTVEELLTRILKLSGYYVFATKEYMSRVRGGSNSTQIRVSNSPIQSPVSRIDILIPLDKAVKHVSSILIKTIIIGDKENSKQIEDSGRFFLKACPGDREGNLCQYCCCWAYGIIEWRYKSW